MLEFPDKFWSKTVKECGMFGQILSTSTVPGLFDVFYDISQVSLKLCSHNLEKL
jgi:hypothetical protein